METGGNQIFCLLSEKSLLCLSQQKVLRSPSDIAHLICLQNPFTHNPERILQESFLNSQDPRGAVKVEGERGLRPGRALNSVSSQVAAAASICAEGEPSQAQVASGSQVKGAGWRRQVLETEGSEGRFHGWIQCLCFPRTQSWLCWVSCQKQGKTLVAASLVLTRGEGWTELSKTILCLPFSKSLQVSWPERALHAEIQPLVGLCDTHLSGSYEKQGKPSFLAKCMRQREAPPDLCRSKWCWWTSNISVSWEFVWNSECQAQPQMQCIQIILRWSLGDLHACSGLRRSCLWKCGDQILSLPHLPHWFPSSMILGKLLIFFFLYFQACICKHHCLSPQRWGTNEECLECKLIIEAVMITWNLILI